MHELTKKNENSNPAYPEMPKSKVGRLGKMRGGCSAGTAYARPAADLGPTVNASRRH